MQAPSPLLLYRRDATRNMARFYHLSIEPTLFGDVALVRAWGRIGTHGRQIIEMHGDDSAAQRAFDKIVLSKRKRGYSMHLEPQGSRES
jgi:predicted DNA-binding WGR domain protein